MKTLAKILIVPTLLFSAASVLAWTGPTASPPNNNVAAPVNTSGTAQVKTGNFYVGSNYYPNGQPFGVGGLANNWTAIFNWPYNATPSGSLGILVGGTYSQFEDPSGYYTELANGSYGVYTNGWIYGYNSFGGIFTRDSYGNCVQGNAFTGGCSCPGAAPNAAFLFYSYYPPYGASYPYYMYYCY